MATYQAFLFYLLLISLVLISEAAVHVIETAHRPNTIFDRVANIADSILG